MQKLIIHILSHRQDQLDAIPERPFFRKVHLAELPIGEYQTNQLSEMRYFLSDIPLDSEYVGMCSARWNEKYPDNVPLEEINQLPLAADVIWVGELTSANWAAFSEWVHPGMMVYLKELEEVSGLRMMAGPAFWSNNFICHRKVFEDFLGKWRSMFDAMYALHQYTFSFGNKADRYPIYDITRHASYFYERLTLLYFANHPELRQVLACKENLERIKSAGLKLLKRRPNAPHRTHQPK